ncbi:hypothetical protein A0J61_08886 [Choanephora cucurbitarum]|uniref:WW domain-containing protein n=1 Tax=Choanephora cucurbitarum TaxID=101091 RepID=A0A1C7N1S6_9FUNG|nr:hypothetical protein A0J61_08886 [Choanephora cucurbitarum]
MGLFSRHKKSPEPSFQSGPPPYTSSNYAPPSPPKEHMNPDSRPLPNGWISQYDPKSNRFFYVYTPNALRQWEHPADKPSSYRGENNSYNQSNYQQRPYYQQQQQQPQQPYYQQQQQPYYQQQPQYIQQSAAGRAGRFGQSGGMGGFGTMAAAGLGGGMLGYMLGDAMSDDHPDIIENNYYGDGGGFDNGGFDNGGFDDGGFGDGGFGEL